MADEMVELGKTHTRRIWFKESDPEKIWGDLIDNDLPQMSELVEFMRNLVYEKAGGGRSRKVLLRLAIRLLALFCVRYRNESDYLSAKIVRGSGPIMTGPEMAAAQRMYTLAHLKGTGGCSTVVVKNPADGEMVCFRSLDWPGAAHLGAATRVFEFVDGENVECRTAGVSAMVGALTGVKTGFAVVVNYAPWPTISVSLNREPTFLVRELLQDESVRSFEAAYEKIRNWKTAAPVFITLCGIRPDEACIFEFGKGSGSPHIRRSANGILVQTNHFDADGPYWTQNPKQTGSKPVPGNPESWDKAGLLGHSLKRRSMLEEALAGWLKAGPAARPPLIDFLKAEYAKPPVWNNETAQWVAMHPGTGRIEVWARQGPA